ncbi:TIGR01777 family oxidoreductase [Uliginosibacterium paludis]|uniref:TIGR01777 family oxidoreductase n=1 Tax=Uliginosibacterium paludis TaxID=1615952 RepID=A0ABV2CU15_9RHOO
MNILITGGTGLLGRSLCKALRNRGHQLWVLSRRPERVKALCGADTGVLASLRDYSADQHFDAIINLAGAPIIDLPWSNSRKATLRRSRIGLTDALVSAIARAHSKPKLLLSGSAVGVYGDAGERPCPDTVKFPLQDDFGSRLCADWEAAASKASGSGVRVCHLRTGLVLAPEGGLLARMKWPFRLGLGGALGQGSQWMSWIHIDDWVAAVCFLLDTPGLEGPFNLTAPEPVRNADFSTSLASTFGRRACLPQPAWLLKAALGQRAYLLLGGQNAPPERLIQAGFRFAQPALDAALANACR